MQRFERAVFACCFLVALALAPIAWAGSAKVQLPKEINPAACQMVAANQGVAIAYYRWDAQEPIDDLRSIPFTPDTPFWFEELIRGWIEEAYTWTGSRDAWLRHIYHRCLSTGAQMQDVSKWVAVAQTRHGPMEYLKHDEYVGRSLELYGEFSPGEAKTFSHIVEPGDWVLEVGANIGAHTIQLAKLAGDTGRVIAIEPQRIVYEILLRNCIRNGCTNAAPIHTAAGETAGLGAIPVYDYGNAGNFGGVSVIHGAGEPVAVIPIDSLNVDKLKLLKIDAEGMEVPILKGAAQTIARCRPVIYVENDREQHSSELIALIESFGYRMWWDLPPLYQADNYRGEAHNAFPGIISINMLCIPREVQVEDITLPPVLGAQDTWRAALSGDQRMVDPRGRAAVFRLGQYGDALWSSSLFPLLKREGYHVTVYTGDKGMEVLKHDPHVDAFVHVPDGKIPIEQLGEYVHREALKYDRFVQLVESIETFLLLHPNSWRYLWPDQVVRDTCNRNYLEFIHDMAQVPREYHQRFYPTADETQWAREWRREIDQLIVLAISGSGPQKWYPHVGELARELLVRYPDAHVLVLGADRGAAWPASARLHQPNWTIRQAMTMCIESDLVIGQETGLLNAVALEAVPKIVLLSHSTAENLTKHWRNTTALTGRAPCYPCHRLHYDFSHCARDEGTGAALCQATIMPSDIWMVSDQIIATEISAAQRDEQRAA